MRRPLPVALATAAVGAFVLIGWYLALIRTATPAGAAGPYCAPTATYPTIQAAINAASDGETVRIVYGTWYENLEASDDITLIGGWNKDCSARTHADPQYTVIDGSAADHVVEITGTSTVTLDGLTVTHGFAQKGGGVYVDGASAALNSVVVTSNVISPTGSSYTEWGYGGGVYIHSGTLTLSDCEITDNTRDDSSSDICFGGGLALESEGLDPAIAVIESTHIMSNTNPSGSDPLGSLLYGGGLYLDPQSQVTFEGTDNLIRYNEARAGGGVYMYGDVDLEGVKIWDNYASVDGGGIFIGSGYDGGRVSNNYLLRNNSDNEGASVIASDVDLEIANNTIVGDLSSPGAGIEVVDTGTGVAELVNNIVVNHAIGIKRGDYDFASMTLSHNDVWNNTTDYENVSAGSTDISTNPEFVNPGSDNYHLDSDSPCIDAGAYVEGLYFDYDGDRRTGRFLDIGADEYPAEYLCFVPGVLKTFTP